MDSILTAAAAAPSPDNNQPWILIPSDNRLRILPDFQRGLPSDMDNMFMNLALGAATENALLAAGAIGLIGRVQVAPFVPKSDTNIRNAVQVEVSFSSGSEPDPLAQHIFQRCTSRKLYSKRQIPQSVIDSFDGSLRHLPGVQLNWIVNRNDIGMTASLIARGDLVRLQHRPFHEELYRQLRFSKKEAEGTRDGLDVRTLEMPPGAASFLKLLRKWKRMQWVHSLGMGRLLAIPSKLAVTCSAAIGILTVDSANGEKFVTGGRALQRVWLEATRHALSFQPLGSLPIFFGALQRDIPDFARHHQTIGELFQQFRVIAPIVDRNTLIMLFRVGYATPPTVRSLRREVSQLIEQGVPSQSHET